MRLRSHRGPLVAWLSAFVALTASKPALSYEFSRSAWAHCWSRPEPESIEAGFTRLQNQGRFSARRQKAHATLEPALLAISADGFRTPFAAGLLLGWGETGDRPDFSVVTGVGFGALIAPFAFVGETADQKLADAFNCNAGSWTEIASHAAGLIDEAMVQAIARKHQQGGRLLVALPGSAARLETVWDLGTIATSRRTDAAQLIGDILVASVRLDAFIDPKPYPKSFGFVAKRNFTFRDIGSGDPFLFPSESQRRFSAYFLLDGNTVATNESAQYIASREADQSGDEKRLRTPLVTAFDFKQVTVNARAIFKFAMAPYQPSYEDVPLNTFDIDYTRRLFRKSYWTGVRGGGWEARLPGQSE